nr:carboxypeptidase s1 like a [Quercus suber]
MWPPTNLFVLSEFRKTEYEPFIYNGIEYGEVRQYGNFSFVRVYEAGHEVPWYQRESCFAAIILLLVTNMVRTAQASFALFNRTIHLENLATGAGGWTNSSRTYGRPNATHTETAPVLASTQSVALAEYSLSIISVYDALDLTTPTVAPTVAARMPS